GGHRPRRLSLHHLHPLLQEGHQLGFLLESHAQRLLVRLQGFHLGGGSTLSCFTCLSGYTIDPRPREDGAFPPGGVVLIVLHAVVVRPLTSHPYKARTARWALIIFTCSYNRKK
ncbi:unnamed protein product, partial [Ectocarpus sp. 12 AP-2014]